MPVSTSRVDDPFDDILRPPPGETPQQRELRLAREEEARRISLAIDASIKAERQARRKKRIVRLLLLGQSESGESLTALVPFVLIIAIGKSTTLRRKYNQIAIIRLNPRLNFPYQNFSVYTLRPPSEKSEYYGVPLFNSTLFVRYVSY